MLKSLETIGEAQSVLKAYLAPTLIFIMTTITFQNRSRIVIIEHIDGHNLEERNFHAYIGCLGRCFVDVGRDNTVAQYSVSECICGPRTEPVHDFCMLIEWIEDALIVLMSGPSLRRHGTFCDG